MIDMRDTICIYLALFKEHKICFIFIILVEVQEEIDCLYDFVPEVEQHFIVTNKIGEGKTKLIHVYFFISWNKFVSWFPRHILFTQLHFRSHGSDFFAYSAFNPIIRLKNISGTFSSVFLAKLKHYPDIDQQFALKHIIPTSHPSRIEGELQCLQEIG